MLLVYLELYSAIEATVAHCHFLVFEVWSVPFVVAALLAKLFQALITFNLFSFIEHFVPDTSWLILSTSRFCFKIVFTAWAGFLDWWLLLNFRLRSPRGFYARRSDGILMCCKIREFWFENVLFDFIQLGKVDCFLFFCLFTFRGYFTVK